MNIDKQELRELKIKVSNELRGIDILSFGLKNTDERLNIYAFSVICNPEAHNLYEQLALKDSLIFFTSTSLDLHL